MSNGKLEVQHPQRVSCTEGRTVQAIAAKGAHLAGVAASAGIEPKGHGCIDGAISQSRHLLALSSIWVNPGARELALEHAALRLLMAASHRALSGCLLKPAQDGIADMR